jgi:hypothetical protein
MKLAHSALTFRKDVALTLTFSLSIPRDSSSEAISSLGGDRFFFGADKGIPPNDCTSKRGIGESEEARIGSDRG